MEAKTYSERPKPLVVAGLRKSYRSKGKIVEAVQGVSLSIEAGEILAFLGPNGAGKTTTVKMVAGLVRPDSGQVLISGKNPRGDLSALKVLGAVLEGNRNIYWRLTPEENLEYFGVLKGMRPKEARRRGRDLLERFGLSEKRQALVQTLSRGMQQKLAIAVSLVHTPDLLLLDEPTLGLDVEAVETIKVLVQEIAEQGCAILLTTHHLDVAQAIAHRIAIISKGEVIIEEKTSELIKRFSGEAYSVQYKGTLSPEQLNRLDGIGALVREDEIVYLGEPSGLYQLFEAMNPVSIVHVEKNGADLTEIFLKLIKEVQHV
jgi:ABC-2 type transport system ATP-binding protein